MTNQKKQVILWIFLSILVTIIFTGISIASYWKDNDKNFQEERESIAQSTAMLSQLIDELPQNPSNQIEVNSKVERLVDICRNNILEEDFPCIETVDSEQLDDVLFDIEAQCDLLVDQSFRYYSNENYSYQDYLSDLNTESDFNMSFEEILQAVSAELPFRKKVRLAASETVNRYGSSRPRENHIYFGLFAGFTILAIIFLSRTKIQIHKITKKDAKFQSKLTQYLAKNEIYSPEKAVKIDNKLIQKIGFDCSDKIKNNPESIYIPKTQDNKVWFSKTRQKKAILMVIGGIIYSIAGLILFLIVYSAL